VHNVSQWPNLRHLGRRPAGSSEFKKATESMGRGRVANDRWEWVPDCGGCNTKITGYKGSAHTRNRQQVSIADSLLNYHTPTRSLCSGRA